MTDQEIKEIENAVMDSIDYFVEKEDAFTSLDVSNYVKLHYVPSARHMEIAEQVRTLYQKNYCNLQTEYNRTIINVYLTTGVSTTAYLYHPTDMSPDEYNNRNQTAIAPKPKFDSKLLKTVVDSKSKPIMIPSCWSPDDAVNKQNNTEWKFTTTTKSQAAKWHKNKYPYPKQDDDLAAGDSEIVWGEVKSDGRLEIPAKFVRQLGWKSGQEIDIKFDNCSLCLCELGFIGPDCCTTITPDGRLRVPKTALAKANFDTSEPLAIYIVNNNRIMVSESREP